jgi:L-lactate dehydrogenase complex protein LldF
MRTSPLSFHRRVDRGLSDPVLRRNMAAGTGRQRAHRLDAMGALAGADALRDHARRIRAHTLARLDEYLLQFVEAVHDRGGTVHWADTAADATAVVSKIATDRGARLVVKSKSMVTEEIGLNAALAAAGVDAVETDLGEFVVQLAGDHPSHIVAPIMHMSKEQVGALFVERLGATAEDVANVAAMTAFARRVLRERFLAASIGVSGVNFGVAETGSVCLVTNEGNGRLCTSVPPVHVAVMGIERLVPTLDDLGVMLDVLARSATGQALTVYTNIVTGPRRAGDEDGPGELHVVLVDNGRTRVLGSELAEILYCIRCGACLAACPVYDTIGGHAYGSVYPGPIGSVLTPAIDGLDQWADLPHASSLCGACREACPVRIDIPRMLLALRRETAETGRSPAWLRLALRAHAMLAVRPRLYRAAVRVGAWAASLVARDGFIQRLPGPFAAWTGSRALRAPARRTFLDEIALRDRGRR